MTSSTTAIIVAAGRGTRAGPSSIPKQYQDILGIPVLRRALRPFLSHPAIDRILVVIGDGDQASYAAIAPHHERLLTPVLGGENRQASVLRGLAALAGDPPGRVLIHDAARPFAGPGLIDRVLAGLGAADAVVPALPVGNTLKLVENARVRRTVDRAGLQAAETPQGFKFGTILKAHRAAAEAGLAFTDDAAVAEWAGVAVLTVKGEAGNLKLTTADDFVDAERRIAGENALLRGELRVGSGYDVHAYGPGVEVMLCGVAIPHSRGVIGHSDGDVALHALTDALLGALAEGDIGEHFPPSDPQWRGASSDRFLKFAADRVAARGGAIANLDVVIIAEAPKIGPHRDAMRARIAAICGIAPDRVGVKATTSENLGFIGRGEGISAMASAAIRLPASGPA